MRFLSMLSVLLPALLFSSGASGQGKPADDLEWRACAEGNADACFKLGIAYSEAKDRPKDIVLASVFLVLACDGGKGCFQLGMLTGKGEGYSREEGRRIALMWRDCEGNVASACFELGEVYRNAKTGPRTNNPIWKMEQILGFTTLGLDAEEAARLCDAGPPTNCAKRAAMSFLGRGAPEDRQLAQKFLDQGCKRQERTACSLLAEVRAEATVRDRYDDAAVDLYLQAVNLDFGDLRYQRALRAMGVELMLKDVRPAQR